MSVPTADAVARIVHGPAVKAGPLRDGGHYVLHADGTRRSISRYHRAGRPAPVEPSPIPKGES